MQLKRGRPSGKLLDKYSFDFDKISDYFKENLKEEKPQLPQEQPQLPQEQPQLPQEQPQLPQEQPQQRVLVFDEKMLIKADVLVSAVLESGLNFLGIKKEVLPIEQKEAEFLFEMMPPLKLEKNWTNFLIAYLTLKVSK